MESQLGRYRIIKHLATGGMGEVYLAVQEGPAGFAKPAVVKRLLPHLVSDPTFVEMFLNEARLAAVLMHPNVVQIYGLERVDNTYLMSMEFVHGKTVRALRQKLNTLDRKIPEALALRICADTLKGLHHAHVRMGPDGRSLQIVHRDMSPDNIMVGFDGMVKVLDFGIAKAAEFSPTTKSGTVKGKFSYMSPEQVLSQPIDPRVDIYAVGVILYELLAGTRPFVATSEGGLVHAIAHSAHEPLIQRAPEVSADAAAAVEKALQKNPNDRFESALQMATVLEECIKKSGQEVSTSTVATFLGDLYQSEAHDNPATLASVSGLRPWNSALAAEEDVGEVTEGKHTFSIDEVTPSLARKRKNLPLWALGAFGAVTIVGLVVALLMRPEPVEKSPEPAKQEFAAADKKPEPSKKPATPDKAEPQAAVVAPETQPTVAPPPAQPVAAPTPEAAPKNPSTGTQKVPTKAFLDVRVNPWGVVYVDGQKVGVTPFAPIEVLPGTREIRVENPEISKTRQITKKISLGHNVVKLNLLE